MVCPSAQTLYPREAVSNDLSSYREEAHSLFSFPITEFLPLADLTQNSPGKEFRKATLEFPSCPENTERGNSDAELKASFGKFHSKLAEGGGSTCTSLTAAVSSGPFLTKSIALLRDTWNESLFLFYFFQDQWIRRPSSAGLQGQLFFFEIAGQWILIIGSPELSGMSSSCEWEHFSVTMSGMARASLRGRYNWK